MGMPVQVFPIDHLRVIQIYHLSITLVPKIVLLHLPRPRTYVPYIAVPHIHATAIPGALDMGSRAVEAPMPRLVAVPADVPQWALLVLMVGFDLTTLAAVVSCQLHHRLLLLLLGYGSHG
jgi:hypothetical protein